MRMKEEHMLNCQTYRDEFVIVSGDSQLIVKPADDSGVYHVSVHGSGFKYSERIELPFCHYMTSSDVFPGIGRGIGMRPHPFWIDKIFVRDTTQC